LIAISTEFVRKVNVSAMRILKGNFVKRLFVRIIATIKESVTKESVIA
jgi:hypothetical protein